MEPSNKFKNFQLRGWRQFAEVDFDLHPRLTIIAGANGAGKSTLLRILSQHFGYNYSLIATPRTSKSGVVRYFSGLFGFFSENHEPSSEKIGEITYSNGVKTALSVPDQGSATYQVGIPHAQPVAGLFIASHRPTSVYQPVTNIPTNGITAEQAYLTYNQEIMNRYNNNFTQYSPTYRIKEAIISMATFGPGNVNVIANRDLESTYNDFKEILRRVLPKNIGFIDISIRVPDVVLVTSTGEFPIDASSGGLMAIIDLAWQIFLYSRGRPSFVILIDEPENHLHPSMQRVIIGNLLDAFPEAQLIVATHSPFVVSSVRDSAVYVLRYADGGHSEGVGKAVFSERLDNINKAGSASDILRSVLGVPVTLPLWVESEIEAISDDFDISSLDHHSIVALRERLERAGLGDYYSDALSRMAARR